MINLIQNLKLTTGVMKSGKSNKMLEDISKVNFIDEGTELLLFHPEIYNNKEYEIKVSSVKSILKSQPEAPYLKSQPEAPYLKSQPVSCINDVYKYCLCNEDCYNLKNTIIFIDEIQFFSNENTVNKIIELCEKVKFVFLYGLSFDFCHKAFGYTTDLYQLAAHKEITTTRCYFCKDRSIATRTLRQANSINLVITCKDIYFPVCASCWDRCSGGDAELISIESLQNAINLGINAQKEKEKNNNE